MARSSKTKPKPNPNPEDMIVNVEDFLAETQAFGKQMEFIIATLRHSAALSNTDWKAVASEVGLKGGAKKAVLARQRFEQLSAELGFAKDADDGVGAVAVAVAGPPARKRARANTNTNTNTKKPTGAAVPARERKLSADVDVVGAAMDSEEDADEDEGEGENEAENEAEEKGEGEVQPRKTGEKKARLVKVSGPVKPFSFGDGDFSDASVSGMY